LNRNVAARLGELFAPDGVIGVTPRVWLCRVAVTAHAANAARHPTLQCGVLGREPSQNIGAAIGHAVGGAALLILRQPPARLFAMI
jgi:hypothetical protein